MEDKSASSSPPSSSPSSGGKGYSISSKCEIRVCPNNVVHFKKCLNLRNQRRLWKECQQIMEIGGNKKLLQNRTNALPASKKAVPVLFWNWPAVKESLTYKGIYNPTSLLDFTTRLYDSARAAVNAEEQSASVKLANNKGLGIPQVYAPNAIYGILYPHGGSFIPHVDGAKAWALAISIGESAIFFTCETEKGERTRMRIDSGDAIIFKGGMLYHGVEEILPGTAPKFWYRNEEISKDMSRFNLQFRDPERDRLEYYPQFVDITSPAKK